MNAPDARLLLASLIKVDSRNPMLAPGAPGETEIAQYVEAFLREAGLEVTVIEPWPGRPSVLGRLPGSGGGPTLLLNGHLDTVGFGDMEMPLTARVLAGRMHGRGSYDMKGGLTAVLMAAAGLARGARLRGDLIVSAVADEEHASIGMHATLERLRRDGIRVDGAIITEPTDLQLCVAHKGFAWATVVTYGQAAHGSRRDEGIDAIAHMGRVLVALDAFDHELQGRAEHPLLGHGSLHASLISGGTELSTYPARCELQIERRTLPGETADAIRDELAALLQRLIEADPSFRAEAHLTMYRPPMSVAHEAAVVQMLADAAEQVLGLRPAFVGAPFWMDAALLSDAGIPTVVFGPRGAGAHADVEWVDLPSVQTCIDVLIATARSFCS